MTSFRRPPPPPNGFSLVEVLVSAAITGLVILGVANDGLWRRLGQAHAALTSLRSITERYMGSPVLHVECQCALCMTAVGAMRYADRVLAGEA